MNSKLIFSLLTKNEHKQTNVTKYGMANELPHFSVFVTPGGIDCSSHSFAFTIDNIISCHASPVADL